MTLKANCLRVEMPGLPYQVKQRRRLLLLWTLAGILFGLSCIVQQEYYTLKSGSHMAYILSLNEALLTIMVSSLFGLWAGTFLPLRQYLVLFALLVIFLSLLNLSEDCYLVISKSAGGAASTKGYDFINAAASA